MKEKFCLKSLMKDKRRILLICIVVVCAIFSLYSFIGCLHDRYGHIGWATYYGSKFHGKKTASGQQYDMIKLTAAHRRFPFGAKVKITNLENNREVVVTINDRGPHKRGRIILLSWMAARQLKMLKKGVAKVRIEVFK